MCNAGTQILLRLRKENYKFKYSKDINASIANVGNVEAIEIDNHLSLQRLHHLSECEWHTVPWYLLDIELEVSFIPDVLKQWSLQYLCF